MEGKALPLSPMTKKTFLVFFCMIPHCSVQEWLHLKPYVFHDRLCGNLYTALMGFKLFSALAFLNLYIALTSKFPYTI